MRDKRVLLPVMAIAFLSGCESTNQLKDPFELYNNSSVPEVIKEMGFAPAIGYNKIPNVDNYQHLVVSAGFIDGELSSFETSVIYTSRTESISKKISKDSFGSNDKLNVVTEVEGVNLVGHLNNRELRTFHESKEKVGKGKVKNNLVTKPVSGMDVQIYSNTHKENDFATFQYKVESLELLEMKELGEGDGKLILPSVRTSAYFGKTSQTTWCNSSEYIVEKDSWIANHFKPTKEAKFLCVYTLPTELVTK